MRPDKVGIMSQLECDHLPARAAHYAFQILKHLNHKFSEDEHEMSHDVLEKRTDVAQTNFRVCERVPLVILRGDWLLRRMQHCYWLRELSLSCGVVRFHCA